MSKVKNLLDIDLGPAARTLRLATGELLAAAGDPAVDAFVVRSGRVAVLASADDPNTVVREVGPGELAGDVPMVAEPCHAASLLAAEETEVIAVPRDRLAQLSEANPELAEAVAAEIRHRLEWRALEKFLRRIVGSIDPDVLRDLHDRVTWVRLDAGERLFSQGDEPDAAYFVATGRLLVSAPDPDGAELPIAELGAGELVGELGLIDPAPRNANVIAIRETSLARISRDTSTDLIMRHPGIMLQLSRLIINRFARPGHTAERATTIALVVTAPCDHKRFVADFVAEVDRHGSTVLLTSSRVDTALGRGGVAHAGAGETGDLHLAEHLDEAEIENRHLVYATDDDPTPWSARVLRRADRVLVVASEAPTDAERARIDAFLAHLQGADHVSRWMAVVHAAGSGRPTGTPAIRERFGVDRVVHLRDGSTDDLRRLARTATGNGIGLVLGGGGARGFAHVGVMRALADAGIPIDAVAGASIGAVMAAGVAARLTADEMTEIVATRFQGLLDYTVPVVSLVKGRRISEAIAGEFGGLDIEDLWLPFFCVSTNLTKSRREVHRTGDLVHAVRSSIAIPGVLPPVASGEDLLVDGGVLDNIPIGLMRAEGIAGRIIAVEVAPPEGPRAKGEIGFSVSGWQALRSRMGRNHTAYPAIGAVLVRSMLVGSMQERDRALHHGEADLFLSLNLKGVSLLDFDDPRPVIELGYEASLPRIEEWRDAPD